MRLIGERAEERQQKKHAAFAADLAAGRAPQPGCKRCVPEEGFCCAVCQGAFTARCLSEPHLCSRAPDGVSLGTAVFAQGQAWMATLRGTALISRPMGVLADVPYKVLVRGGNVVDYEPSWPAPDDNNPSKPEVMYRKMMVTFVNHKPWVIWRNGSNAAVRLDPDWVWHPKGVYDLRIEGGQVVKHKRSWIKKAADEDGDEDLRETHE